MEKSKYIGVLDSGLGGLTVVKELESILPHENILYFGDNANCPYGNRTHEDILNLSLAMLDFLQKQGIKIAVIACNTISAIVEELRKRYEFPIVSIIEEACKFAAELKLAELGIFATEFTINRGTYNSRLQRLCPETRVHGVPSRNLAALVDSGRFYDPATDTEIRLMLSTLIKSHPETKNVLLGCTHYPIVQDLFEQAAPDIKFINPAAVQAKAVSALLSVQELLNETSQPIMDIYTSGNKQPYEAAIKKLEIIRPHTVTTAMGSN